MKTLRMKLIEIMNSLEEIAVVRGAADDYPELQDIIDELNKVRVNSKAVAFAAFDDVNNNNQFTIAYDTGDKIKVWGTSSDAFDLELAFGILGRAKRNVNKEMLYKLFLRTMDGDFDD